MGLIMLIRPDGWRPTYEPSREAAFSSDPATPVVAYRLWQVRGATHIGGDDRRVEGQLRGLPALCPAEWRKRQEAAYCLSKPIAGRANSPESAVIHEGTPSPARECTCGLSAFYDPLPPQEGVSGVVTFTGRRSCTTSG
jgi:hypothetical protein